MLPNRLQWWLPWTLLPPLLGAPYGAQHATRVKAVARLEGPVWGTACKKGQRFSRAEGPLMGRSRNGMKRCHASLGLLLVLRRLLLLLQLPLVPTTATMLLLWRRGEGGHELYKQ